MVKKLVHNSWLLVLGFVLLKLALSLPWITTNPIDLDEPFSMYHANQSWSDLFQLFQSENNPPLHFILLKLWMTVFGHSALSVRSLSLLFSVLTLPVLLRIGKLYFSTGVGIFLCTLFVFSDFHQYYGLEARGYSLFTLLFALLTYDLLAVLRGAFTKTYAFIAFGVIHVLLFYTHYMSLFVFAGELIVLLVYFKKIKLKQLAIVLGTVCIGIAPWIGVLSTRIQSVQQTGTWLQEAQFSEVYGNINKFFNDKYVLIGFLILLLLGLLLNRNKTKALLVQYRLEVSAIVVLFSSIYLFVFLGSKANLIHLFYDRYLFFLTVPLFLLIALFLSSFSWKQILLPFLFLLLFVGRFELVPDNHRNGDELAHWVQQQKSDEIIVAPGFYNLTFLYHYNRTLFFQPRIQQRLLDYGIRSVYSFEELESAPILPQRIVFVNAQANFGKDINLFLTNSGYRLKEFQRFEGDYEVRTYELLNQ
jgi:uncharacterized membrane protein